MKLFRTTRKKVAKMRDQRDISGLVRALNDSDLFVAVDAAEALGAIGGAQAVDALIGALESGPEPVRLFAARALARTGDVRAVPFLVRALSDPAARMRGAAASALAQIGDATAEQPLRDAIRREESISGAAPPPIEGAMRMLEGRMLSSVVARREMEAALLEIQKRERR